MCLAACSDLQLAKHGKTCALSLPVVTRWGSHYQATKQLLNSQDVTQLLVLGKRADLMGSVGKTKAAKDKAAKMLDMAMDSTFWSQDGTTAPGAFVGKPIQIKCITMSLSIWECTHTPRQLASASTYKVHVQCPTDRCSCPCLPMPCLPLHIH